MEKAQFIQFVVGLERSRRELLGTEMDQGSVEENLASSIDELVRGIYPYLFNEDFPQEKFDEKN